MSGHPRRWLPAAVVVLAIAATAIAARRPGRLEPGVGDGPWEGARPAVALGAVILLVVVATNYAKHRDGGYGVLHRAGTATAILLTAAAVLTPIGLLFFGRQPGHPQAPPVDDQQGGSRRSMPGVAPILRPGKPRQGKSPAEWVVLGVLALIAAAVVVLLIYVLIRLLSRLRILRERVPSIDFEPLNPEFEQLAEAVAAGAEALEYEGDAREAVIACYSAMEQAVSAGGGSRRTTDTPEEFLRRVTAANLMPEGPARRLTELFREARFSRHPIAESQRDAAREALRTISEHLQTRVEALVAATAQAQAARAAQAAQAGTSAPADGRA